MRGLAALILLLCSTAAPGQQLSPNERAVRDVLSEQVAAWNRGDLRGYMAGYWRSDSTVFVSGGTRTTGFDSVFARYERGYADREKMGVLTFEEVSVRFVSSGTAVATGVWRLTRKSDSPWGRFTLLLERKGNAWRITYDHTSSAGT